MIAINRDPHRAVAARRAGSPRGGPADAVYQQDEAARFGPAQLSTRPTVRSTPGYVSESSTAAAGWCYADSSCKTSPRSPGRCSCCRFWRRLHGTRNSTSRGRSHSTSHCPADGDYNSTNHLAFEKPLNKYQCPSDPSSTGEINNINYLGVQGGGELSDAACTTRQRVLFLNGLLFPQLEGENQSHPRRLVERLPAGRDQVHPHTRSRGRTERPTAAGPPGPGSTGPEPTLTRWRPWSCRSTRCRVAAAGPTRSCPTCTTKCRRSSAASTRAGATSPWATGRSTSSARTPTCSCCGRRPSATTGCRWEDFPNERMEEVAPTRVGRLMCIGLWLCGAVLSGCGGDSGPARYEVTGKATFDGKPIVAGSISFTPRHVARQ